MAAVLEVKAMLTERYQRTVPTPVRQALRLQKHDKIIYKIGDGGGVILERGNPTNEEDPVLGQYLHFLARDIAAGNVRVLTPELADRVKSLVDGVEVDLDAPLSADGE